MPPTTLAQILVNSYGNAPAVIAESPAVTLTYQQLGDQIEQLAARMRGAGLQPGDIVALVLPNGPAFVIVVLALVRAGLVAAPLDPSYPTLELRAFLDDFQPRAVIADGTSSAAVHGAVATGVPMWNITTDMAGVVSVSQLGEAVRRVPDTPAADGITPLYERNDWFA